MVTALLARLSVKTVGDLLHLSHEKLKTMPGVGAKKIQEIETLIEMAQEAICISKENEATVANDNPDPSVAEDFILPEKSGEMAPIFDRPWDEFLMLSVRVAGVLHRANIKTLREAIVASKDNRLLELWSFGKKSLNELRQALGELEFCLPEESCQAANDPEPATEKFDSGENQEIVNDNAITTLSQRLKQLGVAEQPCSVLGKRFSTKPHDIDRALREIELVYGPQTLGSLTELLRPLSQNCGTNGIGEIVQALETVLDLGLARYLYGENAPSNISALVDCALEILEETEREILTCRLIEGLTLEAVAQRRSLSRERIRQKIKPLLTLIQKRFGNLAQHLMTPLISEMTDAGGLLHYDTVRALTGVLELRRAQFGFLIAGDESYWIWQKEFLTNLSYYELYRRLDLLRDELRTSNTLELSMADVQESAIRAAGLRLDAASLSRLLTMVWGLEIQNNEHVAVGRLMTVSDRFATVLQLAGRPMHLKEIVDIYLSQASGDTLPEPVGEDEEPIDATSLSKQRSLLEHSAEGALSRHKDVLRCGRGTFVHVTALPFSQERLDEIVEWCVERMEGEAGAISTQVLLRELKTAGLEEMGLNPFILKAALSRHPDIIALRKYLVGHAGSFRENGITLRDRVEAVLRNAERPLSLADILQRLPEGIEYFHVSVQQCLFRADFALNLGHGQFCHVDSLGYSSSEREQIVNQAVSFLPEDGTPVPFEALFAQFASTVYATRPSRGEQGQYLLWSMIRKDERAESGRGYFLALKSGEKAVRIVEGMIIDVLQDMLVAFPREVRRELANRHGYIRADQTVYASLTRCVEKGLARRLPQGLYCLPSIDDSVLLNALKAHSYTLKRVLEDAGLTDYSLDDLSLLARYFYRQDLLNEALRILDILFTRADLPEEQRSSFGRLRTVIRQNQEGV